MVGGLGSTMRTRLRGGDNRQKMWASGFHWKEECVRSEQSDRSPLGSWVNDSLASLKLYQTIPSKSASQVCTLNVFVFWCTRPVQVRGNWRLISMWGRWTSTTRGCPHSCLTVCTKHLPENNHIYGKLLVSWQMVINHLHNLCEKSEIGSFNVWHRWCKKPPWLLNLFCLCSWICQAWNKAEWWR